MPTIKKFVRKASPTSIFKGMQTSFNYHSKEWRNLRKYKISLNPDCEVEGCNNPAHTVDHITPINQGGAVFDLENLQCLCKSCNGRKTAKDRWNKREGVSI